MSLFSLSHLEASLPSQKPPSNRSNGAIGEYKKAKPNSESSLRSRFDFIEVHPASQVVKSILMAGAEWEEKMESKAGLREVVTK